MTIDIKTGLMIIGVIVSGLTNYFTMDTRVALLEQKTIISEDQSQKLAEVVSKLDKTVVRLSTLLEE